MYQNNVSIEDVLNMAIAKAIVQEASCVLKEAEKFMILGHPLECLYLKELGERLTKVGMEYRDKVKVEIQNLDEL